MTDELPKWPSPLLRLVEAALNRVLPLTAPALRPCGPLEGRSIALRLPPPGAGTDQCALASFASDASAPDLSISASALALVALAAERGGF